MKSIQTKIVLLFSVIFVFSITLLSYSIYQSSKDLVIQSISTQAQSIAEQVVRTIDVDQYDDITPENGKNDYFYELREQLITLKEMNGLEYLYTMDRREVQGGNYEYYYVLNGSTDETEGANLGDIENNQYEELVRTFEEGTSQLGEFTVDEYGAIVTAYVPIKNNNGEVVGVVGADFNAQQIEQLLSSKKNQIIFYTILSLIVMVSIIYIATRMIVKPLKVLTQEMNKVRTGDFTVQLESTRKDEVGKLTRSFNQMVEEIKLMIHTVKNNSNRLAISSEELANTAEQNTSTSESVTEAIQEITQGANRQLEIISSVSQTVQQMNNRIELVTRSLAEVATSSQTANDVSVEGEGKMKDAMQQFEHIKHVQLHSSKVIQELGTKSKEIDEIVVVITDIANQTNLLALNAAIEAARAGAHGKGFAVVSDEVRKLAEQSADAAKRISDLIQEIQFKTTDAVHVMENADKEVEKGTAVIIQTGQTFSEINASIQHVTDQIQEVNGAITALASSGVEIVQVMSEIESIATHSTEETEHFANLTENQLAMIEEVHASIDQLTEMSNKLDELVNQFQV